MSRYFIKSAVKNKGSLHKQLGIPLNKKIPNRLINKVISAKSGDIISNPTNIGRRRIKVTTKLERRAILARNLRNLRT